MRYRILPRVVTTLGLAVVLLIPGLSSPAIEAGRLRTHVAGLAAPENAGRRAGQPGAARAADYIFDQFRQLGLEVRMQEFTGNRRNVVARQGSSGRHIVVGAHYDGQAGMPSASDNAAGVAMMLELARDLRAAALPVSLVWIAFDDEEQNLSGSRYYVSNPVFPLQETQAAIIFDTLGRSFIDLKEPTLFALGTEYSPELATVVVNRTQRGMLVAGTDLVGPRSDFAPFAAIGIPYLFFTHGTHEDYHGPGDLPERLNYAKLAEDTELVRRVIEDIANLKTKPAYLAKPIYPESELEALLRILESARTEKKDLAQAYRLVIEDMQMRLPADRSRETSIVAASALLGLATPRLSPFMLDLIVAPFYARLKKPEIVRALEQESARWQR
jgi:hypothetical protein